MPRFTRSASRGDGPTYEDFDWWTDPAPPGQDYFVGSYSKFASYEYESMLGQDIDHFHARLRRGELLPFTSFVQSKITGSSIGEYSYHYSPNNAGGYYINGVPWFTDEWLITIDEMHQKVKDFLPEAQRHVQASAAKIYSSGHDTLTFLAELRQTVSMFRGIAKRVIALLKSGKLEQLWLEGRYGWRLLVFDIMEINQLLTEFDSKRKRYSERTGKTTEWTNVAQSTYPSSSFSGAVTVETDYTVSTRGSVVADIAPPMFAFNPITTGWELITFSFVIDWVLTVGSFLESLSFLALSEKYFAAQGVRVDVERRLSVTPTWNTGYSSGVTGFSFVADNNKSVGEYTYRIPSTVPLHPYLDLSNLSFLKVADLLALVRQALR